MPSIVGQKFERFKQRSLYIGCLPAGGVSDGDPKADLATPVRSHVSQRGSPAADQPIGTIYICGHFQHIDENIGYIVCKYLRYRFEVQTNSMLRVGGRGCIELKKLAASSVSSWRHVATQDQCVTHSQPFLRCLNSSRTSWKVACTNLPACSSSMPPS